MLGRPRIGEAQQALQQAHARLSEVFESAGFRTLDVPHLFLGETLLDLYGEDLRARAFLFPDAERGNELCLRPDFTVPVALAHGAAGWETRASYTYQGPVFRRQPQGQGRPTEYLQVGIEEFGATDAAAADARIFALLHRGLAAVGVTTTDVKMGDLSIPFALLDALDMPAPRRAGLKRHFWRPHRFQALLDRACAAPASGADVAVAGEVLGIRTVEDVTDRLARLADERAFQAMPQADADLLGAVLALECPATEAPGRLRALTGAIGLDPVINRFEARLEALAAEGIDPGNLVFDANFGRNLEYYDGFVFEIRPGDRHDHPPLAGGGRYDALTGKLGASPQVPAIGGIIRPEAVLELAQ